MTVPSPSVGTPLPPRPGAAAPVTFPLGWLLAQGPDVIRCRAFIDVARLTPPPGFAALAYTARDALTLAVTQARTGLWHDAMLSLPSAALDGVGTINAVRRLLEHGWDRESPPLLCARRILFRLLAEDDDPAYLFELAPRAGGDAVLVRRGRGVLRDAAAATLAQAGYEGDPRLRGAACRILDRIAAFLRSPAAAEPWHVEAGGGSIDPDARPPSVFALAMLAFMPLFRNEHHDLLDRIYQYVAQPVPRHEGRQLAGDAVVPDPHLVLGDPVPSRAAADANLPFTLAWLELVARLGFLRRHEGWSRLLDRLLDDRDRDAVWRPRKGAELGAATSAFVWPLFPLTAVSADGDQAAEVTFRLGLIARLAGRPIELV